MAVSISGKSVWSAIKATVNAAYKAACLWLAFKLVTGFYEFFDLFDGAAHAFYVLFKGGST